MRIYTTHISIKQCVKNKQVKKYGFCKTNAPLPSIPPTAESREMAGDFWRTLAESGNVGKNFKRIAESNADLLQ